MNKQLISQDTGEVFEAIQWTGDNIIELRKLNLGECTVSRLKRNKEYVGDWFIKIPTKDSFIVEWISKSKFEKYYKEKI